MSRDLSRRPVGFGQFEFRYLKVIFSIESRAVNLRRRLRLPPFISARASNIRPLAVYLGMARVGADTAQRVWAHKSFLWSHHHPEKAYRVLWCDAINLAASSVDA
jgi:hypothetical protein